MSAIADVSLADQMAEVRREIKMRREVYHRLVTSGTLDPVEAEMRTVRMVAVLRTLEALRDRQIGALGA